MTHVVFCKQQTFAEGLFGFGIVLFQFLQHQVFLEKLFLDPDRDRHLEGFEATRRVRHIGFQQAFKLQERLVVECQMIDIGKAQSTGFQHIRDRLMWESGIVLFARKPLFLCSRNHLTINHQRGRAVMVERRNTKNGRHEP